MRTFVRSAVLAVFTLGTLSMYAAMAQKYVDFGKGPATWLMTRDEQKKWKTIANDADAQEFIDLFWARRDPTPGTFGNEFKAEFDARVKYADDKLGDRNGKGSMSDRGRALIVLGFPTMTDSSAGQQRGMNTTNMPAGDASDGAGSGGTRGVRLGARELWTWEKGDAQKFGMPKIEAVFIQDTHTGTWQRDTQRNLILGAYPVAVEKAIVSKDLTVTPEWAKNPPMNVTFVPAKGSSSQGPVKAVRKGDPGAHGLLLVKNAAGLAAPQSGSDPFAGVQTLNLFQKTDDLGYAFEYCGESETVKMTIAIRGTADGKKVNMVAPTEDVPVEAIKVVPGCSMVRASIPLSDMQVMPGAYTFSLKLEDGPKSWDLAQDFKVE
ncbi:MAG TPA: GWxTD domain-containing protein [Thermoanaerobaculia bacterium]|nr:GWxTD domain-containing protein [Thermoanaerobaculia bacterium]